MKKLLYVRHGQSQTNVEEVFGGQLDTPLTDTGRQEAAVAGEQAKTMRIDYIISSPLSRAYDTATIIADTIGHPRDTIERDARLMERDYGPLTGRPWEEPVDLETVPGIESRESLLRRAQEAYQHLKELPFETILIVSHGTFYRALRTVMNPDSFDFHDGDGLPNAVIVELQENDRKE